ncbi:MAG: protein kinase [Planctomycetes bacterium]|nr:protein kinase [Planctomycetota bacterium]
MRYKEVEAIFVEVVDLPVTRRGDRIAELTQDRELIQIVQQMLDENDLADQEGFMDASVLGEGVDWEAAEPTPPMPERIGKYAILKALGHGASGTVYLAQAPLPLERMVAIKLLHTGAGELTMARFREEQRVLARLQNVGIAEVYDQGVTVLGMPFTVLEYIDGVSITEHCEQNRLGWRAIIELMTQCTRAVSHAHQRNIIHRDLKPSNLMVTQKNDRACMKVIDFGTAKLTDPLRTAPHLTVESQFIGTLTYSSPEQLSGNDAPDTRTDVHALGLVLYECLEGKHPFFQDNDGLKPMIDRIMTQPLPTISSQPNIPIREINAILSRACAKDISERYSSMLHFGEDLQNLLSGLPVKAMRPRPAYIARKFIRRNRLLTLNEERETHYVDNERVKDEVKFARRMFADNGWPVIDVTRRSIEETAAAVIRLYNERAARGTRQGAKPI